MVTCSALKRSYREQLMVSAEVKLVYLKGSFEVLRQRLAHRTGHFMTEQLLASQLETLEEPSDAITVDVQRSVPDLIAEILRQLRLR